MCLLIDFSGILAIREERGFFGYFTLTHIFVFSVWITEILMACETIILAPWTSNTGILSTCIQMLFLSTQEVKENYFSVHQYRHIRLKDTFTLS